MNFTRENNNAFAGDPRIIFGRLDLKRKDGNILLNSWSKVYKSYHHSKLRTWFSRKKTQPWRYKKNTPQISN